MPGTWSVSQAREHYRTAAWGDGFFDVSEAGRVIVRPNKRGSGIDLLSVIEGLRERELTSPLLLRFPEITAFRMRELKESFDNAIAEVGYSGTYTGVYPLKVNPARHVCEEIGRVAEGLGFGFEVGTKPELMAVLALTEGRDTMPIVCNGFKDDEFLEMSVLARKLGRRIVPVAEQLSEVSRFLKVTAAHDFKVPLGIRVKLAAQGGTRWARSSGHRGKFGLSPSQVLAAVRLLEAADALDSLRLIHCHIGSQISDIRHFKDAVAELAHFYVELRQMGAPVSTLDIGGGLGVDYDGSGSDTSSSANYGPREYADDVVYRVAGICDQADVPHPNLLSESGRAMSAYSSVLICEVVSARRFDQSPDADVISASLAAADDPPQPLLDLMDAYDRRDTGDLTELLNDTVHARSEATSLFRLGYLSLEHYAASEDLTGAISRRILARAGEDDLRGALADLPEAMSDIYFVGMSLFQSLPDSWAIDQLFPVMPIHRLTREPDRTAVLADVTCDSDGLVDRFVAEGDPGRALRVHDVAGDGEGDHYYLGVFLVGAYQETLGDLHNLFGDTHAVHVREAVDGGWELELVVEGDTVREVLSYVQFDPEEMRTSMRRSVEQAIRGGRLTVAEGTQLRRFYVDGLEGYTYPEADAGGG